MTKARRDLRLDPADKRLIEEAELPYPDPRHRDPFDRMLIAQALAEGIPLLSADQRFGAYRELGLGLLA